MTETPIIVSGMHRSGTSLIAGVLHRSGVCMGQNLMGASFSNAKGHYEDLEFLSLHRSILEDNNVSPFGWTTRKEFTISPNHWREASRLILRNQTSSLWGFKDPRTTLLLKFWRENLPKAKFIFSYRPAWEVADSLFRRASICDQVFEENPKLAVEYWLHYNRQILKFISEHPTQCILVEADDVVNNPKEFINAVGLRFGLTLKFEEEDFVEPGLISSDISCSTIPKDMSEEFPEIDSVFAKLKQASFRFANNATPPRPNAIAPFRSSGLNTWVALRKRDKELRMLRVEMDHVCGTLDTVLRDIETLKTSSKK